MRILTALFFAAVLPAAAQSPQVPHKMEFAGITLIIRDDARAEIQKDVDAMTKSPKHYYIKVERARSYFPIIEKVFAEEQLPDDFKYLALQESSLIPDAVSTSNAVGFWQFKDFTAIEMGLRVDRHVDERLNIVASSRAAARYIKKNNTFFDNWIYALQAYQMGAGGVMKAVSDTKAGASRMEIDRDTYWYVKKFLAHKIAYEPAVTGKGQIELLTYENRTGKSLKTISREVGVSESDLLAYNKWTKSGDVPDDRTYIVAIPLIGPVNESAIATVLVKNEKPTPKISTPSLAGPVTKKRINGVIVIQASAGETSAGLAARAAVSHSKFLKWNDLEPDDRLIAGEFYFLGKKRGRAESNFHKITEGENLWLISQRYGVQLKKLYKYNRLDKDDRVRSGNMIYLASMRPKTEAMTVTDVVAINESETFNWDVKTTSSEPSSIDSAIIPAVVVESSVPEKSSVDQVLAPVLDNADSSENLQESAILQAQPIISEGVTDNSAVVSKPSNSEHVVQAKETLYSIAKIYQVGVMDLVKWNNLDLQQGIKIGQVLKVTDNQNVNDVVASQAGSGESVHEVKASDTLYSIARLYGVTIKDLMDWNGKKDFSLSVGEKLRIQQRR